MKTKIFTKNSKGKIEFTEKELKSLLDEMYNEGYADGSKKYYYTTPYYPNWWYYSNTTTPLTYCTTATSTGDSGITISSGSCTNDSTTATINNETSGNKKSTYKYIIKSSK